MNTKMKTILRTLSITGLLALLPVNLRAEGVGPYIQWTSLISGTSAGNVYGVAVDPMGNVYTTGYFRGTFDFGPGVSLTTPNSISDIFVAKFAPNGTLMWAKRFGDTGDDNGFDIGVDNTGNVFVLGRFVGTVDFGGGPLVANLIDMFLIKLDTNGTHIWSKQFDAGNGRALAVDPSGNSAITGEFTGSINLGGGVLGGVGSDDIFLARYNSAGTHTFSKVFGNSGEDLGHSVAIDAGGNVLLTGRYEFNVSFGGATFNGHPAGSYFVVKFNSAGTHQWSNASSASNCGFGIATDASSNVVLTGHFEGTINFGGGNITATGTPGTLDAFLVKFSSAGAHVWSKGFAGPPTGSAEVGTDVAISSASEIHVVGGASDGIDLGGGFLEDPAFASMWIGKFAASGTHIWSAIYPGDFEQVAVDPSFNVFMSAGFANQLFLRKFGPDAVQPCIQSIVDVGNDQGKQVKIYFAASPYDEANAPSEVIRYDAYRRNDPLPALLTAGLSASRRDLLAAGWEFVGSVPAHGEPEYLIGVPTLADSTDAGVFHSVFFIRAATGTEATFYDSPIDSGYSIDNLSPEAPTSLLLSAGVLTWRASNAPDFDHYTVYGGSSGAFASATLVDRTSATMLDVSESPHDVYFVTASDAAGNESPFAKVSSLFGGGGAPAAQVLSVSNHPNPFNPRTTIQYTVPSRGPVTVTIYDAGGTRVRALITNDVKDAGAYTAEWDGRGETGVRVSSGVYFARIEHRGTTKTRKLSLVK